MSEVRIMAKKETKTNAMRILDAEGVLYDIHTYDVSDDLIDGVSVACDRRKR